MLFWAWLCWHGETVSEVCVLVNRWLFLDVRLCENIFISPESNTKVSFSDQNLLLSEFVIVEAVSIVIECKKILKGTWTKKKSEGSLRWAMWPMGLFVLVADLIADTVMARQGYPRIGISACFGGPLFSIL